ncbi:MAG: hypothetical protein WCK73_13195 [Deltaproteobacteria bacterium]
MAPGPKKMVVGFNHNIKYRGQTFHAQTEDSGPERAQISTHLFLGGNIVATKRASYAEIAAAENLPERVRALMEEQHKEVLRNLVRGLYDEPAPPPPTPVTEHPAPPSDSLFGDDLISERSLDEVILAYLAEEDRRRPL